MTIRQFKLSEQFIEPYKTREVPWGPLGYVTYKRTYSRRLNESDPNDTGTEEWWQTCRRVIEGMFHIQKKHVQKLGLPWNDAKAQKTAKDAYERMFVMKWLPPGRGLWMMGTDFLETRGGAAANNCGFCSTETLPTQGGKLFAWIMDALMLGIGVGFDTLGAGKVVIKEPGSLSTYHSHFFMKEGTVNTYTAVPNSNSWFCLIADSREGWVESVQVLTDAFLTGSPLPVFNYSSIRKENEPIRGFGGTSSGYKPLEDLHINLVNLYSERIGSPILSTDIVDTENYIGKCVIAGNVRRSASLALGQPEDHPFLTMKNDQEKLYSHRWGSNNSVVAKAGMDYTELAKQSVINGEPGYIWLDTNRSHGRLKDPANWKDSAVKGLNPCVEQSLEHMELCTLTETFPAQHTDLDDYLATLKIAYLYGKTVTLINTHWPETNAVMGKNRRIGLSMSGIVQAINLLGYRRFFKWCDVGYNYIQELDKTYSDWLCVPRSKKTTSVKPSGTVSLLNGSTPGMHFPEDEYYIRRIRFSVHSDMLPPLMQAGYFVEPDKYSPNTMVVEFPVHEKHFKRGKRQVSMWEQMDLAADLQYWWADNSVSVTVTFKPEEAESIAYALEHYETRLKAVSFLRYEETGYEQAPYEPISQEVYKAMVASITPVSRFENIEQGSGTKYCDGDSCEIDFTKMQ